MYGMYGQVRQQLDDIVIRGEQMIPILHVLRSGNLFIRSGVNVADCVDCKSDGMQSGYRS